MNGESPAELLRRVSAMISEVNELAEKARAGKLSSPFAEEQGHPFMKDITSGLRDITDAMKRGNIQRFRALLIAAQGQKALAAIAHLP